MPNFSVSLPVDIILKADNNEQIQDLLNIPSESLVNYLSSSNVSLSSQCETLASDVNSLISVTDAHESLINANVTNILSLSSKVDRLSSTVNGLSSAIVSNTNNIATLSTNLTLLSSTNANTSLVNATSGILFTYITNLSSNVDALENNTANIYLSNVNPISAKANLDILDPNRVAFYDRFDDFVKYPDNTTIVHNATYPISGSPWRISFSGGTPIDGVRVVRGGAITMRNSSPYLGANATVADKSDFSLFFEFTRQFTQYTTGTEPTFTINLGAKDVVSPLSGIQPAGKMHINMTSFGIAQAAWCFNTIDCSALGSSATNVFTSQTGNHGFLDYDLLITSGVPQSAYPAPLSAANSYYVIYVNDTQFKLANTRADVLSGNAIQLTTNGLSALNFARSAELLNRLNTSSGAAWAPSTPVSLAFQGVSANSTLSFLEPHGLANDTPIMVEGTADNSLPIPLQEKTLYRAVFSNALSVSARPLSGGTYINLTSNGLSSQRLIALKSPINNSITSGRKSMLIIRVKNDIIKYELVGVGSIEYRFRGMVDKIFNTGNEISFYWQTGGATFGPPYAASTTRNNAIYSLNSVGVDAPKLEESLSKIHTGYASSINDTTTTFPNCVVIADTSSQVPMYSNWNRDKFALGIGGRDTVSIGNAGNASINGNVWSDGFYAFTTEGLATAGAPPTYISPGYRDLAFDGVLTNVTLNSGSPNISFATNQTLRNYNAISVATGIPANTYVVSRTNSTAVLNNSATATVAGTGTLYWNGYRSLSGMALSGIMTSIFDIGVLPRGSKSIVTINGTLNGLSAKRLYINYQVYEFPNYIFDTDRAGTILTPLTGAFTLTIDRTQTAQYTHLTYTTFICNGVVIGPQVYRSSQPQNYGIYQINTATEEGGGIILETGSHLVAPASVR